MAYYHTLLSLKYCWCLIESSKGTPSKQTPTLFIFLHSIFLAILFIHTYLFFNQSSREQLLKRKIAFQAEEASRALSNSSDGSSPHQARRQAKHMASECTEKCDRDGMWGAYVIEALFDRRVRFTPDLRWYCFGWRWIPRRDAGKSNAASGGNTALERLRRGSYNRSVRDYNSSTAAMTSLCTKPRVLVWLRGGNGQKLRKAFWGEIWAC